MVLLGGVTEFRREEASCRMIMRPTDSEIALRLVG
jgi:hypothetical protein